MADFEAEISLLKGSRDTLMKSLDELKTNLAKVESDRSSLDKKLKEATDRSDTLVKTNGEKTARLNELGDQLEHIHNFGQPFIAAEYSHDLYVHDVNIAYAELAGTDKSFALGIAVVEHIDVLVDLFDTYLGEEGEPARIAA